MTLLKECAVKDNIKEIKYHKKRILDDKSVKRVLLFSAPTFDFDSFDIDAQRKAGAMIYHPIGLPMLAAVIREDSPNIEMKICDAEYETVKIMFETNQKEDVLKKLVEKVLTDFKPDLVGISVVFSPGIKAGFEIASMTRAFDSNIIISFGGVHCTFDYENILKEDFADVVFLYESEITFSGYIKYLNGMEKVESIRGIVFLNEKEEIVKIPYESPPDFDALPIPAWDLLDTTNYYKVSGLSGVKNIGVLTPKPKGIINTVRGCVARCTFCSVRNFNGFGVRMREPEDVLNEIDILYNDYGIRYLEVVDDDFSFDHDRSVAICKGLIERNYDLL